MEILYYLLMKMDRSECGIEDSQLDLRPPLKHIRSGQVLSSLEELLIYLPQARMIKL